MTRSSTLRSRSHNRRVRVTDWSPHLDSSTIPPSRGSPLGEDTMTTTEPTWAERLAASTEVDIRPVLEGRQGLTPGKTMLYSSARIVNEAIRAIPAGQTVPPNELRTALAIGYGADYSCPVTTARMLVIVAGAANETHEGGAPLDEVTPSLARAGRKGIVPNAILVRSRRLSRPAGTGAGGALTLRDAFQTSGSGCPVPFRREYRPCSPHVDVPRPRICFAREIAAGSPGVALLCASAATTLAPGYCFAA